MSVVIRMQRAGGRNRPFYRVVVADSRAMRDGRFLEKVGFYNPLTNPAVVDIDEERVRYWVDRGAKPSESVASLLKRSRKGLTRTSAMPAGQPEAAPVAEAEKPAPPVAAAETPVAETGAGTPAPSPEPAVPEGAPAGDTPTDAPEDPEPQRPDEN